MVLSMWVFPYRLASRFFTIPQRSEIPVIRANRLRRRTVMASLIRRLAMARVTLSENTGQTPMVMCFV